MVAAKELTTSQLATSELTETWSDRVGAHWWREPRSWAVLITLLLWAVPLTHASGGRGGFVLTWAVLALIPALALVAPWRHVRRADLLALVPAVVALALCFAGRTGFDGAATVSTLAYAALLYLLVRGYLAGGGRTTLVVAAVLVGGLDQFIQAWWPWYGGGHSSALLVGTFYWHNQFAVFMAAIGVLGATVAARGTRRLRLLGGAVTILAVPALAFAGSRSTLALFGLTLAAVISVSLRDKRALLTLLAVPIAGVVVALVLAGPMFMSTSDGVTANVDQRETVVGNGSARVAYDRAAFDLVKRHPLTGTGFGTFAGASAPLLPANMQPTLYTHNGYAQSFVDGGVLLGTSMLLVALAPLVVATRRLWRGRLGRRGDAVDARILGSYAALGLLAVHSAVDVDWTYPSLLALFAVLAAVAVGRDPQSETEPRSDRYALAVLALVLVVTLPVTVLASAAAAPTRAVPVWARAAAYGLPVTDPPPWAEGVQACTSELRAELGIPRRSDAALAAITHDLDCTAAAGRDAPSLQMTRARGLMALGRTADAHNIASELTTRYAARIPQLLVVQAALPQDAGDATAALPALTALRSDPRVVADPATQAYLRAVLDALTSSATASAPVARKDQ